MSDTVPRAVALLGAAYLTAGSLSLYGSLDGDPTGVALLAGALAGAWLAVAGVFGRRLALAVAGLVVLGVVGALNPLFWEFVMPAAAAAFVAVLLVAVRG